MPIMEGSVPAMLPGGMNKAARKPDAPNVPLTNRLAGTPKLGFPPGPRGDKPAFKKGKRAF